MTVLLTIHTSCFMQSRASWIRVMQGLQEHLFWPAWLCRMHDRSRDL